MPALTMFLLMPVDAFPSIFAQLEMTKGEVVAVVVVPVEMSAVLLEFNAQILNEYWVPGNRPVTATEVIVEVVVVPVAQFAGAVAPA